MNSWLTNGLNEKILNKIKTIKETFENSDFRIVLTGHSLGGSVASLAAFDIAKHCEMTPCSMSVYTFGAPRCGNHAFVSEYNAAVPDTWHIINDQVKYLK